MIAVFFFAAATAAASPQPSLPDGSLYTIPEVIVRGQKTLEERIRARGWVIKGDSDDLGLLSNDKVVCKRITKVGTHIPPSFYTCGTAGQWREITFQDRQYLMCHQNNLLTC